MTLLSDRQRLGRLAARALIVSGSVLALRTTAFAASSDPIRIDDCYVVNNRSYVSPYKSLVLTFTNRRAVPADEVHFTVEYAGKTAHITDTGIFSQNIGIHHSFSPFQGSRYHGKLPDSCTVDYVHYSDSTLWTPQSPAPTAARPERL